MEKTIQHECPCRIVTLGVRLLLGTRKASSLVKILIHRVRNEISLSYMDTNGGML